MKSISPRLAGLALAWALLPLAGLAAAPPPETNEPPEAHGVRLLGELRQAVGGATAWDTVTLLHVSATLGDTDQPAAEEAWLDIAHGRLLVTADDGPTAGQAGFDGTNAWTAEIAGGVHIDTGAARSDHLADAFVRTLGWLRVPYGRPVFLRADTANGRHCDVLRLIADGGVPIELWLDRSSHLPVRTIEQRASGTVSVQYSQWRKTKGAALPWHEEITGDGTATPLVRQVTRVEVDPPFDAARLTPPAAGPPDFNFPRQAASVELPMKLINGHVFIDARIGKDKPLVLHMMFDTGATLVLDAATADRAGLIVKPGATTVHLPEIRIAGIALTRQTVPLRDLSGLVAVEGVPVDGVIGADLARRLTVELDYDGQRMVLLRPDRFVAPPGAIALPIAFAGLLPTVAGRIDGIPATLVLDTGHSMGLAINGDFARAHGLAAKWHARPGALIGWDDHGALTGALAHAGSLEIGVLGLAQPLAVIAVRPLPAGDAVLGGQTLRRFDVVLDYRHNQIWLQPNRSTERPDGFDHAGLWLNKGPNGPVVADIVPNGPAARAGLLPGDVLTLVNGDVASTLSLPELRERLEGPAGSAITFGVKRGNEPRDVRLLLADPLTVPLGGDAN